MNVTIMTDTLLSVLHRYFAFKAKIIIQIKVKLRHMTSFKFSKA